MKTALLLAAAALAQEPTISTDAAVDAAQAALAHCRAEGQKVSVTVVDAAGRPKVSIRDDGAAPHSAEHSFRKAYTALTYRMTSGDVGKLAVFAGVYKYPARVKCAILSWHALMSALKGGAAPVTTESENN